MSEKPNIIKTFDTALSRIDEAVGKIEDARELASRLHVQCRPGVEEERMFQDLDDKLHDALAALGQ